MTVWFRVYNFLFIFLLYTKVDSAILRGPNNVVGIWHENAILDCKSRQSQKVKWTFVPLGRTDSVDELNFPFHYHKLRSSRGDHQLTLESITFQNAGRYVCRVEGPSSNELDAAAAFVVVVANPPHCASNSTGKQLTYNDSVSMECSITFMGQHNLTLEWLAPDDNVVKSQDFWSDDKGHVARLPLIVNLKTSSRYNVSTMEYKCRSSFGNRTTSYADEASNSPEFPRNTCTVRMPSPIVSSTVAFDHEQTTASTEAIVMWVLAALLLLALTVIALCVYLNRARIASAVRRRSGRGQEEPPNDVEELAEQCNTQNDQAAGGTDETRPMLPQKNDVGKRPEGLPEPVSDIAGAQEAENSISPGDETITTSNVSNSVNSPVSSATGYDDTEPNASPMFDLHEDSVCPDQSSEQPTEADTEDQIG